MAPRAATAAGHQIQSKPIKVLDSQAPYEGGQRRGSPMLRVGTISARLCPRAHWRTLCERRVGNGKGAVAHPTKALHLLRGDASLRLLRLRRRARGLEQ